MITNLYHRYVSSNVVHVIFRRCPCCGTIMLNLLCHMPHSLWGSANGWLVLATLVVGSLMFIL